MHEPTFMILGAPKCGTSSLAHYLSQHPDVLVSTPKEPPFFEAQFDKGLRYYTDTYYSGWAGQRAVGEARTFHLFLPFIPARIHRLLPGVRLIAAVRDPVERAYSHWWHRFSRGGETLDFEDAIQANLDRIEKGPTFEGEAGAADWCRGLNRDGFGTTYRTYLDAGYYAQHLERYESLFPRDRIEVLLFDDLVSDPVRTTQSVCDFLGVARDFELADASPQNVRRARKKSAVFSAVEHVYRDSRLVDALPRSLKSWFSAGVRVLQREMGQPPMSDSARVWLAGHFAHHNRQLESRLGRDLSSWGRSEPGSQSTRAGLA